MKTKKAVNADHYLKTGKATRELSKLIPEVNLRAYKILYDLLSRAESKISTCSPDAECNKIRNILNKPFEHIEKAGLSVKSIRQFLSASS